MLRTSVSGLSREERDEAVIEARTLLLSATIRGPLNIEAHSYIRNWIARRMDVVALSLSLVMATLFLGMIALVISVIRPGQLDTTSTTVLSVISATVIITMVLSIWVLRRQVIEVIAGIYRTYS